MEASTIVITGASSGLGYYAAQFFLKRGSTVVVCSDNRANLTAAYENLKTFARHTGAIEAHAVDVSSYQQVKRFIDEICQKHEKIDALINNAGIGGPLGDSETNDPKEWSRCIEVNLIGVMHTCNCLIPRLKSQKAGKIINISGGGATSPLPGLSAYAASKAAVVRYTETLSLELKPFNIDVNAVAPGALPTNLTAKFLEAGPDKIGDELFAKLNSIEASEADFETAARCISYLASDVSNGVTGKLIAAKWDDWASLHENLEKVNGSDIYTLRRLIS